MKREHGIANALKLIHRQGGNSIQITLGPPHMTGGLIPIDDSDRTQVNKLRAKYGFYVVVHGKYLYNFCRKGVAWQKSELIKEMVQASSIDADVVIHQGHNLPELNLTKEKAHSLYVSGLVDILRSSEVKDFKNCLILENSARQGTETGYSLNDLTDIYRKFPDDLKPRIKFCLDLCHVFVSGELDVRSGEEVKQFLIEFDKQIGDDKLALVHFNDSGTPFNGANDNHADLLKGYIGCPALGGNPDGFKEVVKYCACKDIPMICETSGQNMVNDIKVIKQWAV